MDVEALLLQSLQLLGLGMGSVFIILTSLIVIISLVSRIVPEEASPVAVSKPAGIDPTHVAAISAALHLHRNLRNK